MFCDQLAGEIVEVDGADAAHGLLRALAERIVNVAGRLGAVVQNCVKATGTVVSASAVGIGEAVAGWVEL